MIDVVRIYELIALARARDASDLHLGGREAPSIRVDGALVTLGVPPVAQGALEDFAAEHLTEESRNRFPRTGTADAARRHGPGAPYRLHAYRTTTGLRLALRFLASSVPMLETLGLPATVASFAVRPNGLVLFTGPTGSGKTTALAALVDRINRTSERVIVTVEVPSISKPVFQPFKRSTSAFVFASRRRSTTMAPLRQNFILSTRK